MPAIATAVVGIGQGVTSTVSQISDTTKRRNVEAALQRLSYNDQKNLNEKIARAQSDSERLNILINAVSQQSISAQQSKVKTETILLIVFSSLAVVTLITVLIIKNKK